MTDIVPSHTGLYRIIRDNYDSIIVGIVRQYVRSLQKMATTKQHLAFNLRAKRYNLIPRSLRVKPLVTSQEGRNIANNTSRSFLLARISQNVRAIRNMNHDLYFQRRQLEFQLRPEHMSAVEEMRLKAQEKMKVKCKERQKRKFDLLLVRSISNNSKGPTERWVVNRSTKNITTQEERVLAKGLNFTPAPKRIPVPQIIAAVEDGFRKVHKQGVHNARIGIIGILKRSRPPPLNLSMLEYKALRDLRKDDSIIILPSDKGRATVVLDKTEYEEKITTMLSDTNT